MFIEHCYLTVISRSRDASNPSHFVQQGASLFWSDLTSIDCRESHFIPIYDCEGKHTDYWTFLSPINSENKSIRTFVLDESLLQIIRNIPGSEEDYATRWSKHEIFEPFGKLDDSERKSRRQKFQFSAKEMYMKLIPRLILMEELCRVKTLTPAIVKEVAPSF